jgi:phosphoglucomutase
MDTYPSEPAFASALEVLAANGINAIDRESGYNSTPVTRTQSTANRGRTEGLADGL